MMMEKIDTRIGATNEVMAATHGRAHGGAARHGPHDRELHRVACAEAGAVPGWSTHPFSGICFEPCWSVVRLVYTAVQAAADLVRLDDEKLALNLAARRIQTRRALASPPLPLWAAHQPPAVRNLLRSLEHARSMGRMMIA